MGLSLLGSGCRADSCERLCDRLGNRLDQCLVDWPISWEDLDATSKTDFQQTCWAGWATTRTALEPRQLDDALKQCGESVADLAAMRQDGSVCDQLRALYIP